MTITKIQRQRNNPKRFSIFLDGEFAFGLSDVDVLYYKLQENSEMSEERCRFFLDEVLYTKAKDAALNFLGYRARSQKEIADKLADEYPEAVILRVMDMLESYGYIDDEKFAAEYISTRLRTKGYGAARLKQELWQRGVDGKIIDAAIAEAFEAEDFDEAEAALSKLVKKAKGAELDQQDKRRLYGYLMRQGYSHDAIESAFRRYQSPEEM